LGDYKDALNREEMQKLGITHILVVALGIEPNMPKDFRYMTVRAQDHDSQDLLSYLGPIHRFIDEGRKSGGILVHCKVGQSRSVMITTSYVMKEKDWSLIEALEFVAQARPRVRPRATFKDQLDAYHVSHYDLTQAELQAFTSNYPNKAQLAIWPATGDAEGSVEYLLQPLWVKEDPWREGWDAVVHLFMDFFNRYLRFYFAK
jgi:hypothetical protein